MCKVKMLKMLNVLCVKIYSTSNTHRKSDTDTHKVITINHYYELCS